jgi:hypothetical protein
MCMKNMESIEVYNKVQKLRVLRMLQCTIIFVWNMYFNFLICVFG